eukprot:Gb_30785 [translate_table: standard]
MAMSAFKSTTKRTQIGSQENNSSISSPKAKTESNKAGGHRRSRSLSHFPRHYAEFTASSVLRQIDVQNTKEKPPTSRNASPVRDFNPGRFVNTVRGSAVPEHLSSHVTHRGDSKSRRGRSVSRHQTDSANDSPSEAEVVQRRGRSVTRNAPKQPAPLPDNGRRRRSVSVSRHQYSDSEQIWEDWRVRVPGFVHPTAGLREPGMHPILGAQSDIDPVSNQAGWNRLNNLGTADGQRHVSKKVAASDLPKYQQGLRRCLSQMDLSRSYDGYSSYASTLTDDDGLEMHSNDHAEEKTIKAVYAQMKSFRSDHPTGDMDAVGLYEAMRSEVRHAVGEIRFELEQAIAKKSLSASAASGSHDSLEPKTTDVIQAVADIRKDYTAKLEQSEKRARDLWAELAVEEQRCQELARIVEELLPEPKSSQTQRPLRRRKVQDELPSTSLKVNSADRKKESKCLNEEAQKYFDEFVSISKIEDSEISSFEEEQNEAPTHGVKTEANRSCYGLIQEITKMENAKCSCIIQKAPLPAETDGVVLPWLQWETNTDNHPQFSRINSETVMTAKNTQQNNAEEVGSIGSNSICGSRNVHVTSSNGSCSPDSSYLCNISSFDPSMVESINLSSTRNSEESGNEKGKHKVYNKITKNDYIGRSAVRRSYQNDEYYLHTNNEAILIETMKLKSRIDSGGLILCGTRLL